MKRKLCQKKIIILSFIISFFCNSKIISWKLFNRPLKKNSLSYPSLQLQDNLSLRITRDIIMRKELEENSVVAYFPFLLGKFKHA